MYPDTCDKIRSIYVMGGNYQGVGNITKCAEFNFWCDPEAVSIVIKEKACPLYILPWETCIRASMNMPHKKWRFGVLNTIPSEVMSLMDKIEENLSYKNNFVPCDAFLIALFCFPKMIKDMKNRHVSVELQGNETRGQMIIDHKEIETPNAFVIEDIDGEFFKKVLLFVCGHEVNEL